MTLREKLRYEIGDNCEHSSYCIKKSCQTENGIFCFVDKQTIENCEQIADDFAIGFAEWIFKNKGNMELYTITSIDNSYILKSTKELLEIYKNEKDL